MNKPSILIAAQSVNFSLYVMPEMLLNEMVITAICKHKKIKITC